MIIIQHAAATCLHVMSGEHVTPSCERGEGGGVIGRENMRDKDGGKETCQADAGGNQVQGQR